MHVMATAEAGAPAHQLPGGPQPEGGPEEPPSQFAAKVAAQRERVQVLTVSSRRVDGLLVLR